MTKTRSDVGVVLSATTASLVALAGIAATPLAHADSLDAIRGAVNGARAESTCPPLAYSGQLEAAAQELARLPNDAYERINPYGYQGATSGNLVRDDPTARATSELVAQEERIPMTAPTRTLALACFGTGVRTRALSPSSWVSRRPRKPHRLQPRCRTSNLPR